MKFNVKYTSRFKKDYKRLKKRGYDMGKLLDVKPARVRPHWWSREWWSKAG